MKLDVIILNYGKADMTLECLESVVPELRAGAPGSRRALVLDNGSDDDSADRLAAALADRGWADCVELRTVAPNRGFSGGNNVLLREFLEGEADFAMLLNNDTIVRPGAFDTLLSAADRFPGDAIFAPRLEWPDATPQRSIFRYPSPASELIKAAETDPVTRLFGWAVVALPAGDDEVRPDWVTFACALIRRAVFERVGVLDEGFFLYFDDPDFCRRARRAGFTCRYVPSARVVHLRGQSNPLKEASRRGRRRPWYHYASRTRYFRKYYGPLGPLAANTMWLLGHAIARLRWLFGRKPCPKCERELTDMWTNFFRPMAMPTRGQDG